jgi:hypothetical protein
MKAKFIKISWGVILVFLIGLLLATQIGYVNLSQNPGKSALVIFTGLSIAFFASYFLRGVKHWTWLFPALFSAALALNAARVFEADGIPIVAFPFLLSIAIPFYIGYLLDRKHWEYLVPAWILTIIAVIPPLSDRFDPDVLTAAVLYAISLPFLVGYLVDQRCKWALLISAALGFIGIYSLVETFIHGDILGPIVLLIVALPFFITFFASRKRWWALLPSGVFISIGLVALLDRLLPVYDYILVGDHRLGVYTGLLFLGFAITFALMWRLNPTQPKDWARYPVIGFTVASALAFLMGDSFDAFLPAISVLIVGIVLVYALFLKERVTHQPTS